MSTSRVVEELDEAAKYLEDAWHAARNGAALLDRVSQSMGDDARSAMAALEDIRSRARVAVETLESL